MSKRKPKIETCRYAGKTWHKNTVLCEWANERLTLPLPTKVKPEIRTTKSACVSCEHWEAKQLSKPKPKTSDDPGPHFTYYDSPFFLLDIGRQ